MVELEILQSHTSNRADISFELPQDVHDAASVELRSGCHCDGVEATTDGRRETEHVLSERRQTTQAFANNVGERRRNNDVLRRSYELPCLLETDHSASLAQQGEDFSQILWIALRGLAEPFRVFDGYINAVTENTFSCVSDFVDCERRQNELAADLPADSFEDTADIL